MRDRVHSSPLPARLYAGLLRIYPLAFREEYGAEMRRAFATRWDETLRSPAWLARTRLIVEVTADAITTAAVEHAELLGRDVAGGFRSLTVPGNRSFSAASVATLALGISAFVVIFSVVHAALLAPLPVATPERLIRIAETSITRGISDFAVSYPNYESWGEGSRSFDGLAAVRSVSVYVGDAGVTEHVTGFRASHTLWPVLGQTAVEGRTHTSEEDVPGSTVVVISEGLWRRRFGSDPAAIGRTVRINGKPKTVIGVVPQDAAFAANVDVWLPLPLDPGSEGDYDPDQNRADRRLTVIGRLASGVTAEQAQAELDSIVSRLRQEFPSSNEGWGVHVQDFRNWIVDDRYRQRVLLILAAVGVLLLTTCANVAGLQITRAAARAREIGVRRALGASPSRLVRLVMTESALIAAVGGVLGLLAGGAGISAVRAILPPGTPRMSEIGLTPSVAIFAAGLTAVTALLAGIAPTLLALRSRANGVLDPSGRSASGLRSTPARQVLAAAQIAAATALLMVAGLLLQNFARLQQTTLGFDPARLLTARFTPGADLRPIDDIYGSIDTFLDSLRALPGVTGAGIVSEVPFGAENNTSMLTSTERQTGRPDERTVHALWRIASSGALEALGARLESGRFFDRSERPRTVILSRSLVRRLWPDDGVNPVDRTIWLSNGQSRTVVGVVDDIRHLGVGEDTVPTMYFPITWTILPTMSLAVRAAGSPEALSNELRRVADQHFPATPLYDLRSMESAMATDIAEPRLQTTVLAAFAVSGLILAAVGIAGVIAFTVQSRSAEFALRMAVGASSARVIREVLSRGMTVCAAGAVAGVGIGTAFSLMMEGTVGTPGRDLPGVALVSLLAAIGTGLIASWIPGRRVTRIDPADVLRRT